MKAAPRILGLAVLCFLVPLCAPCQDSLCSSYLVPLLARNPQGELIKGLSPNDLEVKLNGRIVQVENIQRESRPRRIVILLDASGSMRGLGKAAPWSQAVASADLLATLAEGRARLALVIFNQRVIEEIDFGSDNSAVTKRLGELEEDREFVKRAVYGSTGLYDALSKALQLLPDPTSADALYLATDGGENSSHTGRSEIEHKIDSSGLRVFVSLLENGEEYRRRRPEELGSPLAIEITHESGGGLMIIGERELRLGFEVRRKLNLLEALRLFFEGIFENSTLRLSLFSPPPQNVSLQIALSQNSRNLLKGTQFFYPRKLYRCPAQQRASTEH